MASQARVERSVESGSNQEHSTSMRIIDLVASKADTLPRSGGARPLAVPAYDGGDQSVVETGVRRLLIVLGVMLAALLQTLDSTITNVALPNIQGNLGASIDEGTWVINGYTIAVVIVIPMIPWLQTTMGRKRYFLICIAGFTAASFACGISTSIEELIAFRVVQGIFGAGLLATSQMILRDTFPPEQLGVSQGIFALGAIMGPALGPPLGGILVDNANWNWVFDINVVPGIASFLLLLAFLRDPTTPRRTRFDFPGLLLLVIGIGSFQYVLSEGERWDWFSDTNNCIDAAAAAIGISGLIWWELRTKAPLVDLRAFRYRAVWGGFILAMLIGGAIFGSTYTLPQVVQNSLDFTATLSGLLILMRAIPIGVATPFIARFVGRVDARIFMAFGFFFMALGNYMQATVTTLESNFTTFVLPLMLTGVGAALLFVPLTTAVLGGVPLNVGAKASAYVNLGTQLGGTIAIAALSTMVDRRSAFHLAVLAGNVLPGSPAVLQIPGKPNPLQLLGIVQGQATILAYADVSLAITASSFIAIFLVLLMPKPKKGGPAGGVEM
jgi:DHA2 family multidrug resistance protein